MGSARGAENRAEEPCKGRGETRGASFRSRRAGEEARQGPGNRSENRAARHPTGVFRGTCERSLLIRGATRWCADGRLELSHRTIQLAGDLDARQRVKPEDLGMQQLEGRREGKNQTQDESDRRHAVVGHRLRLGGGGKLLFWGGACRHAKSQGFDQGKDNLGVQSGLVRQRSVVALPPEPMVPGPSRHSGAERSNPLLP